MKHRYYIAALLSLPLLAGCDLNLNHPASSKEEDCRHQANERIALYNKPDIYPISEEEKRNALDALFNECMRDNSDQKEADMQNARQPEYNVPAPMETPVYTTTQSTISVSSQPTLQPPPPLPDTPTSKQELENILIQSN